MWFRNSKPSPKQPLPTVRRRILVVDDEVRITELFKSQLTEFEVITASDGLEALRILNESSSNFDYVFCDLSMPRLNGQELYNHVKNTFPGKEKNFIFITGGAATDTLQNFLSHSANPTIEKPLHFDIIRGLLK